MSENNFMLVSLDEPKMKSLSEVLGNKTCKLIIDYLTNHHEASQKDLADALNLSMSKVDYNMKKLVSSGLVQKRKNFFWSKKGKKILMYELSNKSIIISPKKSSFDKFKSILPGFIVVTVGTFVTWVYERILVSSKYVKDLSGDSGVVPTMAKEMDFIYSPSHVSNSLVGAGTSDQISTFVREQSVNALSSSPGPLWAAFLAGGLLILLIFSILNWRKL